MSGREPVDNSIDARATVAISSAHAFSVQRWSAIHFHSGKGSRLDDGVSPLGACRGYVPPRMQGRLCRLPSPRLSHRPPTGAVTRESGRRNRLQRNRRMALRSRRVRSRRASPLRAILRGGTFPRQGEAARCSGTTSHHHTDVIDHVEGLYVTTPLRTASDLMRALYRHMRSRPPTALPTPGWSNPMNCSSTSRGWRVTAASFRHRVLAAFVDQRTIGRRVVAGLRMLDPGCPPAELQYETADALGQTFFSICPTRRD